MGRTLMRLHFRLHQGWVGEAQIRCSAHGCLDLHSHTMQEPTSCSGSLLIFLVYLVRFNCTGTLYVALEATW